MREHFLLFFKILLLTFCKFGGFELAELKPVIFKIGFILFSFVPCIIVFPFQPAILIKPAPVFI